MNTKAFADIVSDMVTAVQAQAAGLVDTTIGSLLRAVCEANAGVVQWIQSLIVQLLVTTRLATCSGTDVDSWLADYGFYRLSAVQSTGSVTFSRFTPTYQALIPIGAEVVTTDGSQTYSVIIDTINPAYSATLGGYVIAAGTNSVICPVQANIAGSAGNALAGTVSVISGGIQYVDTVTNPAALANGADEETDTAVKSRFVLWVASLSKGTKAAIGYAISSVQSGVSYTLVENQTYGGLQQYGYFYAVIDDGSGAPSSTFMNAVGAAIEATRAFTVTYGVFPPTKVTATVSMMLTVSSAVQKSTVIPLVQAAVQQYIASLTLGQLLSYTMLASVAYGASSAITNVTGLTINGLSSDLSATSQQVIRAGTITVN